METKSDQPKVVVIGGGSGQPVILGALKDKGIDTTAIVTVADDGGSSGVIRDYMNIVPPGDIRNALLTLSTLGEEELAVFQHRFNSDDVFFQNHAIGNLIIAAMTEMKGNVFDAVQLLSKFMQVEGRVLPVANEPLTLHAEFSDGTIASGEHNITHSHNKIKKVWVKTQTDQDPEPAPEVVKAILEADIVVLGPGSLYTSILPNVVIPQVSQALIDTPAKVVYVSNIMTQLGETDDYTDANHVEAIHRHTKEPIIDYILTNSTPIPDDYIDFHKWDEISEPVEVDEARDREINVTPIIGDYVLLKNEGAFHDANKIVNVILGLLDEAPA